MALMFSTRALAGMEQPEERMNPPSRPTFRMRSLQYCRTSSRVPNARREAGTSPLMAMIPSRISRALTMSVKPSNSAAQDARGNFRK